MGCIKMALEAMRLLELLNIFWAYNGK